MGAYSSKPETSTTTEEGSNGVLTFGASAMQGWRLTQEDAHVALLDFDEGSSKCHFFAVFDGHGGAEVAQFAAQTLPTWVKKLPAFKEGDISTALTEAFLTFDQHLTEKPVIEQLKALAGDDKNEEDEDEQINEAIALQEEADMPIEQLMAKYSQKVPAAAKPDKKEKEAAKSEADPVAGGSGMSSSSTEVKSDEPAASSSTESAKEEPSQAAAASSSNGDPGSSVSHNGEGSHVANGVEERNVPEVEPTAEKAEKEDKAEEQNGSEKQEEVANGDQEVPKKVGKGKQRKIIIKKPKREIKPAAAYQQFLEDYDDDQDSSSEDEPFGPANAISSDSEDEALPDEDDSDDSEDDEEEESESDSSDAEEQDLNTFFAPTGDFEEPGKDSGCTAVVALVRDQTLFVANAGDSRCVVSCAGKAIEMSEDHKPEDERELQRIEKAGGKVTLDGRVNGGLNLSRALGDHTYKANTDLPLKDQMISPEPDVRQLTLTPEHEFMILACDGIWNSMTSQEVVDFVKSRLDQKTPAKICEELFAHCLAPDTRGDGTGCDNMTAIIVTFDESRKQTQKRKADAVEEPVTKKAKDGEDGAQEA